MFHTFLILFQDQLTASLARKILDPIVSNLKEKIPRVMRRSQYEDSGTHANVRNDPQRKKFFLKLPLNLSIIIFGLGR